MCSPAKHRYSCTTAVTGHRTSRRRARAGAAPSIKRSGIREFRRAKARIKLCRTLTDVVFGSRAGAMSSMYPPRAEALVPSAFVMTRVGMNSRTIHRKTGARTSIRRMAITMTTRRVAVRRERVEGWPIFRGLALPNDLAAISIEITRSPNQEIDHAVGAVSAILGTSLAALGDAGQLKLWLVIAGAPIKRTDRVAAYRANREKVWGVLERQGISVPSGSRRDLELPLLGDSFGLLGSVELEPSNLQAALRVTRLADAVCLATHPLASDPLASLVPRLAQRAGAGIPGLLVALIQLHANWTFAARAFGEFDDHSVGVEVFAFDTFLDVLEPIMTVEASSTHDHGE